MNAGAAQFVASIYTSAASAHIRCSALVSFVVQHSFTRCEAKRYHQGHFWPRSVLVSSTFQERSWGKQFSSDLADGLCCCDYGNVRTVSLVSIFTMYFVQCSAIIYDAMSMRSTA
jgi:hypothetical protein